MKNKKITKQKELLYSRFLQLTYRYEKARSTIKKEKRGQPRGTPRHKPGQVEPSSGP